MLIKSYLMKFTTIPIMLHKNLIRQHSQLCAFYELTFNYRLIEKKRPPPT